MRFLPVLLICYVYILLQKADSDSGEDFAKDIAEVTADEDDADEPEEEKEKPAKKQPAKKAPAKAAPKKKAAPKVASVVPPNSNLC